MRRKYYNLGGCDIFECEYYRVRCKDVCNHRCEDEFPCLLGLDYFDLSLRERYRSKDIRWAVQNLGSDNRMKSLMAWLVIEGNEIFKF